MEVVIVYGIRRGLVTLIATAAAGALVWTAARLDPATTGGYWRATGIVVGAGLALAVVHVLGKGDVRAIPRPSPARLLGALPALVATAWIVVAAQPHANWFRDHVATWSADLGIANLVDELRPYALVLAFGLGLVLGLSFERDEQHRAPVEAHVELPLERPAATPLERERPDAGPPSLGTDRARVA